MAVLTMSVGMGIVYALLAIGAGTALGTAADNIIKTFKKNNNVNEEREAQEDIPDTNVNNDSNNSGNNNNKTPIINANNESTDKVQDKTNENIESNINGIDFNTWFDKMKEERNERWQREDQIRKETQMREDTAYQRAVEDALKAGINPNLISLTPAGSGGGITTASKMDDTELTAMLEEALKEIELSFKEGEGEKDRISQAISTIVTVAALLLGKRK